MRKIFKPVLSGLLLMFAMSAMAQGTNEYLQPCDKPLPTYKMVWSGNMLEDPEGFQKQMEEMMKSPRNYDVVCWSTKVEPSFEESYEIQCVCNSQSLECRLELKVQNQTEPHVLEIDEELAYQIRNLIDAAVYSANNLPEKQWMQQKLDILKSGEGVMAVVAGVDGTTYRFFNRQYGAKCWSPRSGNNAALVSINQAMYNAIGKKDVELINSKLSDIKSLAKKYASLMQDPYREYYLLRIDKKPANWVTD